ncbi:MAG TPA: hypothetical protein ENG87_04670, partial [Candidatus Pacearchaeota archaeon]|nr:hypothetical protein [Candidatus Pacearchaeota archaeon]
AFGLRSKHSKFDRGCRRRGIKHIRTAIHSPTTTGKIERFFQTLARELKFCVDHHEFRMRYNHFRPHTSLHGKVPAEVYFSLRHMSMGRTDNSLEQPLKTKFLDTNHGKRQSSSI